MNRKSISEKTNGVRFVLSAKTCVLEPAGRASVLEALGVFTDARTKFSSCSLTSLAAQSRRDRRSVERAFKDWRDPELQSLVIDVSQKKGGPGEARLFRVHWERLRLVASAVGVARRSVGAGAYDALGRKKLLGAAATADACSNVFGALHGKLLSEGQHAGARRIERLQARLAPAFEGWPERILDQANELDPNPDFEAQSAIVEAVDEGSNYDNLSANYDKLSSRYYKEDSPQGFQKAREGARGPVDFERSASAAAESAVLPLSLSHIAAVAGGNARRRAAIAEALIGCQAVSLDGWLVVRASGSSQCDQLNDLWFGDLVTSAMELGYRGIMITDRTASVSAKTEGGHTHAT